MAVFDEIENVNNREAFIAFLENLADDYKENNEEWVNDSISDYLESIEEKNLYWINTVEKVFIFLETKMKCQDDKLKRYITSLRESDIRMYKQKVTESYEVRGIY